jgi:hypothetical protein
MTGMIDRSLFLMVVFSRVGGAGFQRVPTA